MSGHGGNWFLKMMVRDRQTLFWALAFPLVFVAVFGLFDIGGSGSTRIAIIDEADTELSRTIQEALAEIEFLRIDMEYTSQEEARQGLEDGNLEYLLVIPQALAEVVQVTGENPRQADADTEAQPVASVLLAVYYDQANLVGNQMVMGVIRQFLDQINLQLSGARQILRVTPQAMQVRQVDYFDIVLMGLVGMGVMVTLFALAIFLPMWNMMEMAQQ